MTEGLFLITTLFVAYVIYVIVNEKKTEAASTKPVAAASSPKPQAAQEAQEAQSETVKAVEVKEKTATSKTASKPATTKKPAPSAPKETVAPKAEPLAEKGNGLKDPKSGEIVKTYTNYRFTKRWIKEALVAEKLVDKIYKNDELNPEIEDKIKAGIAKLETMKKYKP